MSHQQGRLLLLAEDLSDVIAYIQPGLIIQGRERLIQKQKVRLQNQRPDESGPLAHAAGQFGRAGILELAQAIDIQKFMGTLPGSGREHVLYFKPQYYVVVDRAPFKEFVMLKHISYIRGTLS